MPDELKIFDYETLKKTPSEKIPEVIPEYDIVDLEMEDLSGFKKLRFKDDAQVSLGGVEPLPQSLDLTNCSSVDLSGRDTSQISPQKLKSGSTFRYAKTTQRAEQRMNSIPPLSPNIDISHCQTVIINDADLSLVPNLKFAKNADISLAGCTNLPDNLELSNLGSVDLSRCDLSQIKNLKFAPNTNISLAGCTNLPDNLDLSNLSSVDLSRCDLSNIKNLKFKDDTELDLSGCTNLPDNLDLSNLNYVNLSKCDLSNVKNLKFKDGAKVDFSGCTNLPDNLDLSTLSSVNLSKCNVDNIELKFRENADVGLSNTILVSLEGIDFSNCNTVNLSKADLTFVEKMQFKDGAEVNLSNVKILPDIDLSKLSVVNLQGCNLSAIKNINFRDGSEINLAGTEGLPQNLDVSNCKSVRLTAGMANEITAGDAHIFLGGIGGQTFDVSNLKNFSMSSETHPMFGQNYTSLLSLKSVTFKDRQQYEEYLKNENNMPLPEACQIIFASDENLKKELHEQKGELPPPTPTNTARCLRVNSAVDKRGDQTPPAQTQTQTQAPSAKELPLSLLKSTNSR